MMPVEECPFECAINGYCGSEKECEKNYIWIILAGVGVGLLCLFCLGLVCCDRLKNNGNSNRIPLI